MKTSLVGIALATLMIASCDEAPTTSTSDGAMEKGPTTTPANPVLTYQGAVTVKGKGYNTVAVMDVDGTHQTHLYGTSRPLGTRFNDPSWSPTGASISFIEHNGNTAAPVTAVRALDVTVNSSGVPVASNVRTVYNLPTGYGTSYGSQWSSTTGMGKIAFTTYNPNTTDRTLWVIPQTGGTAISVWGSDATYVKEDGSIIGHQQPMSNPTWSPDDQRLAAVRLDSAATANPYAISTIMIFSTSDNGSTWTYTDSIKLAGTTNLRVFGLEWSRGANGVDKLAFSDLAANANKGQLYYIDPVTGAVPTTNGVLGRYPSWSPDNTSLIFNNISGNGNFLSRITAFSTNVTNVVANPAPHAPSVRWRR